MVPDWTGVGSTNPFRARFACRTDERGNSIKVFIQDLWGKESASRLNRKTEGYADNFQLHPEYSTLLRRSFLRRRSIALIPGQIHCGYGISILLARFDLSVGVGGRVDQRSNLFKRPGLNGTIHVITFEIGFRAALPCELDRVDARHRCK